MSESREGGGQVGVGDAACFRQWPTASRRTGLPPSCLRALGAPQGCVVRTNVERIVRGADAPHNDHPGVLCQRIDGGGLSFARIMGPGRCHDLGTILRLLCHLGVCGGIRQAEWAGSVSLRVPAGRAR